MTKHLVTDKEAERLRYDYSKAGEDPAIVPLLDTREALIDVLDRMLNHKGADAIDVPHEARDLLNTLRGES